jgi:hypothetical protein
MAENKRGRPPKLIADEKTLATLHSLAVIQCTWKEAAAFLKVSEPTFGAFLKRHKKARETWDSGIETGKISLRRVQLRLAETNAAMAIFLGKNLLGQSDRQEHSGPSGGPIQHVHGLAWMTQEQAKARGWA